MPTAWTPRSGPIRVEVVKGLEQVRVILEPNEWGIELDAVYDGFCEAHLESRHFDRQFSRVTFDSTRFAQVGGWTGTLRVGDREIALTPDRWWGSRDRSWGIRPVGESEPPGIRVTDTVGRILLGLRAGAVRGPRHGHHHPGALQRRADHAGRPPGVPVSGSGARPSGWAGPSTSCASPRAPARVTGATLSYFGAHGRKTAEVEVETAAGLPPAARHAATASSPTGSTACTRATSWSRAADPAGRPDLLRLGAHRVRGPVHLRRQVGYGMFECAVMGAHEQYGFTG